MAEKREPIAWVTRGGKHIPIFADEPSQDEKKKDKDIEENKKQADEKNGKVSGKSKEERLAELQKQYDEAKGLLAKGKINTEIQMVKEDWKGTKEEYLAYKEKQHQEAVQRSLAKQKADEEAKKAKEEKIRKNLEEELKTQPKHKVEQYKIIQEYNPMRDDYHVGIRKPSDIKTWEEAIQDKESFSWGDFSKEDAEKALKSGKITIYSSYPIKQGVFVSTSYAQAEQYAGGSGGKVYSKTIPLSEVAWINGDEGQYAKV